MLFNQLLNRNGIGALDTAAGRCFQPPSHIVGFMNRQVDTLIVPHEADGFDRLAVPVDAPRFGNLIIDVLVQQENLDVLGTVGKQLEMNVAMFTGGPVQDRACQERIERRQFLHELQRHLAEIQKTRWLAVREEYLVINADFALDFGIVRHDFAVYPRVSENLACRLPLRRVVAGAVFGYHSGCGNCDFATQQRDVVIGRHEGMIPWNAVFRHDWVRRSGRITCFNQFLH